MKKRLVLIIALTLLLYGCTSNDDKVYDKTMVVAINATNYLSQHNFAKFYLLLDSNSKNNTSVDELEAQVSTLLKVYGSITEFDSEGAKVEKRYSNYIVTVPVKFSSGWMNFEYQINEEGSVLDFNIIPSDKIDENGYDETVWSIEVDGNTLNAVYTKPNTFSQETATVILLHDFNALDKNGTIGANKVLRQIAYSLAEHGVASIRYDRLTMNDNINDSFNILSSEITGIYDYASTQSINQDKVYLLGYGVGGYTLAYCAENISIAGYIISSAPLENLPQFFYDINYQEVMSNVELSEEDKNTQIQQLDETLKLIDNLKSKNDYSYSLFGYSAEFWLENKNYDVINLLNSYPGKVLITSGSNDSLISNEIYNQWKEQLAQRDNTQFKFYKDMNHFLSIDNPKASIEDSSKENVISDGYINDIVNFVK